MTTHFFYVGIRPCGCVVRSIQDRRSSKDEARATAESVAECIGQGLVVERIDQEAMDRLVQEPTFLNCKHSIANARQFSFDLIVDDSALSDSEKQCLIDLSNRLKSMEVRVETIEEQNAKS